MSRKRGDGSDLPPERAALFESVAGVIEKMALRFARLAGTHLLDDLRQSGNLGALEATHAYALGSNTGFEGFAWQRIAGAQVDFLRKNRPRLSSSAAASLDKAIAALEVTFSFAAALGHVDPDDLEEKVGGAAAAAGIGLLCMGSGTPDLEKAYALKEEIAELLGMLKERDQKIVVLHVVEGKTFEQVGALVGVHADTARKRFHDAMGRLQEAVLKREGR